MKPKPAKRFHPGCLAAGILALLILAGCSTPPEAPRVLTSSLGRSLRAGFVYQEEVHAVGKPFSLADDFWSSFFPAAAAAFKESHRFDSYEEALRSDMDVLVVLDATVHGARQGCKITMEMLCRDRTEKELLHHGFREKTMTDDTAAVVFEGLGKQTADILSSERKLRKPAPRGYEVGL